MTATLQSRANGLYPRALLADLDFRDNRYPTVSSANTSNTNQSYRTSFETHKPSPPTPRVPAAPEPRIQPDSQHTQRPSSRQNELVLESDLFSSNTDPSQEPQRGSLSYALPMDPSRRVVERYSLDNNDQPTPSRASNETRPTFVESIQDTVTGPNPLGTPQASTGIPPKGRTSPTVPSTLRNPLQSSTYPPTNTTAQFPTIIPLSASPTYAPPVAPNHRAYPQQPTYVTQSNTPNPIQTVYTPIAPPQEEVCVECAMRDQDMADVDVTSPGVWERASDAAFEELKQRILDDEANGIVTVDDASRPRIKGGRLTEQNVKLWLSINPREPASRQQTLNTYIKSQRTLLEAEAVAHARAMQEAKQLDNRMRDAYSQLRRSAYDMGSSSSPADDLGGVRIKPPQSPTTPSNNHAHTRSRSREITLLENGMIVEHVDVRKEEKEARERRRKEEKRARKTSRSSVMDASIISAQSNGALTESGLKPYSRYSQASSARPTSILTAPLDRPDLPYAYSQASFSDVHSLGSSSPRRTRFFGIKNLSAGWRSQDSLAPSGMSGSMVDMHVALQREACGAHHTASPIDLNTPRRSQIWPPTELDDINQSRITNEDKTKKKKGGLAKIWRIVTGSGKSENTPRDVLQKTEGNDDDLPLAPPPPLSYLVDRGPTDLLSGGPRHASTPSLPSVTSAKFGLSSAGMSPPTAPSSILPSPTSLRPPGPDIEIVDSGSTNNDGNANDQDHKFGQDDPSGKNQNVIWRSMQPTAPEPETRPQTKTNSPRPGLNNTGAARAISFSREKSLPPLPAGELPAPVVSSDLRPRTLYTYDPRQLPPGSRPAHDFLPPQAPFRTVDVRRQSFGGTSSRPNLRTQTMPVSKPVEFDAHRPFGLHYDEFGISRRSLESPFQAVSPLPLAKRKSKFGLSSLLGKRQNKREQQQSMQENPGHQFPTIGYSPYETQDDVTTNGYATSSRHSAISTSTNTPNPNLRISVTSRKALEELVQQDADFVAYRYPSNDQRLDLLR
ncbi:hypothetical protein BYT27DRAFT_7228310 [Phlegmacium glaucopus]|nr:hypothetical protein BYT27DRAFT_7228310 [Phlegmacium glaucopus]